MSLVLSRSGAFFSVAVVGLISVPLAIKFSTHAASVAVASETQSPENPGTNASSPNLEVALIRAGLDPRALAAAGVSSAQVSSVAAAVSAHLAQSLSAISDADQAYAQARVEHDALDRKVGGGTASQEEITALAAARQALDSARALRASRLDALHTAGATGLSFDQRSRLAMLRLNADKPAPIEFKVVERTEAEWVALRDALSNERSAAANGEQPNAGCQSLLGSARSNSTVAAAKSAIDTNLAAVQSAWSVAVGD
jgi:hypothetical protein